MEYAEHLKAYKKLLRRVKRSTWRVFCRNAESVKENARMYKILKGCTNPKERLETLYKPDGSLSTTPDETLEVMTDTHFQDPPADGEPEETIVEQHNAPAPNHQPTEHAHTQPSPAQPTVETIYSLQRFKKAVDDLEPLKAPGPDGIYPIVLKKASPLIENLTRRIMMRSHTLGHVPNCWRESRAIFIPKPGKTDYCRAKSYRTITLSPVLLKLQERLVYWHMLGDHNMDKLTSNQQFGFKKGVSTETALHKIVHRIERRITQKGYTLGTFLDIEGAFDNVSFSAISTTLQNSPLDTTTTNWIINMVSNRYVTVAHKTATKRIRVKRGCPQGGVLSPFLWNLIVDDLLKFSAKDIPGYLQAFADDLIILCEGLDLDIVRQRTQKTIETIEKWCRTKGLNISAMKTQIVMFTWKRKWTLPKPIRVGGMDISLSTSAKFLGITLDAKLNFSEHITNIAKKATASLMQCRKAIGPTWGLTPKTCLWTYTRIVRPMLSYSAVVWVGALDKQVNSTKLERVQALALRITCGTLPGTSHESLNHVTNTPGITTYLPKRGSQRGSTPTSQRGMDYRKAPTNQRNNHPSCCNQ